MRNVAEIESDIAKVRDELQDVHGTTTEVYARIVGYYRSVRNWNRGKREEYNHRQLFVASENRIIEHLDLAGCIRESAAAAQHSAVAQNNATEQNSDSSAVRYELFVRQSCPNCPPVKAYCSELNLSSTIIDVDSAEGFARASKLGVFSAPTVIFFDSEGTEISRSHSVREIKTALSAPVQQESFALGM